MDGLKAEMEELKVENKRLEIQVEEAVDEKNKDLKKIHDQQSEVVELKVENKQLKIKFKTIYLKNMDDLKAEMEDLKVENKKLEIEVDKAREGRNFGSTLDQV